MNTVKTPLVRGIKNAMGRKETGDAPELDHKQVTAELKRIGDEVKQFAEKSIKEIKAAGDMSEATKAAVDDLLTKQGEYRERLQDLEQKLEKGIRGASDEAHESIQSVIEKCFEDNPEIKALLSKPRHGKQIDIPISRKALTNSGVTGAALNYPGQNIHGVVAPLVRRLTIRDLLMQGRTDQASIYYPRESGYTDNTALVSEGSLKPKNEITFEQVTSHVKVIANLMDISLQMLNDIPWLQSYIAGRGIYGLKLEEEDQLLNGSGTGINILGIYTAATPYVMPTGAEVTAEQDLDKLRLALLQVELADAFANGIVLHPTNWTNIELLKDGEYRYLFTSPQGVTTPRLWGRDVVPTKAMTLGRFLAGDFAAHAQVVDREDANIAISFENKDNFERNMATLRIEERLALAIYRPEAFVKGVLESAS